jgi:hypothetical protein
VLLGLPLLTADYDLWISSSSIELLNQATAPFGLIPTAPPAQARTRGRYVLENDEHVDVICAATLHTQSGEALSHADAWARRQAIDVAGTQVAIPSIRDLILLKRIRPRAKDLEDIRALETLLRKGDPS